MVQNPTFETLAMVSALVVKAEAAKANFDTAKLNREKADEEYNEYVNTNGTQYCDAFFAVNNKSVETFKAYKKANRAYTIVLSDLAEALDCYNNICLEDEQVIKYLNKGERNSALYVLKYLTIDLAKRIEL